MAERVPPHPERRRCPKCGCTAMSDNVHVWCTFVGSERPGGEKACYYGINSKVTVQQHREGL